jgi:hypothetical protein
MLAAYAAIGVFQDELDHLNITRNSLPYRQMSHASQERQNL